MSTIKKLTIIFVSIFLYTICVSEYVILLLFLAMLTYFSINPTKNKITVSITIIAIISGFVLLKALGKDDTTSVSLPIGYSVFAFSALSLIIDSRRYVISSKQLVDTLCYLFFFPRMLAGPLISYNHFCEVLKAPHPCDKRRLYIVFKMVILASFCKFCIADNLDGVILSTETNGINTILGIIIFAIQLYLDFYAYSIFAIALGMLIGIDLPVSFNSPYRATTLREFWKRWNITVSQWLRDYVYIPLGGKYSPHRLFLVLVTFIVSGLWHGFAIPFILWGLCHGLLSILEQKIYPIISRIKYVKGLYSMFVLLSVALLWQLFKIGTVEGLYELVVSASHLDSSIDYKLLLIVILAILVTYIIDSKRIKNCIFQNSTSYHDIKLEVLFVLAMILLLALTPHGTDINFFYFKF